MIGSFCVIYVCVRLSEVLEESLLIEELCSMTPLAGLGLLHKVGWAVSNESTDLY